MSRTEWREETCPDCGHTRERIWVIQERSRATRSESSAGVTFHIQSLAPKATTGRRVCVTFPKS